MAEIAFVMLRAEGGEEEMNNAAQRVVIPSAARDLSARTAEIPRLRLGMTPTERFVPMNH
jgi:hypothetical protein